VNDIEDPLICTHTTSSCSSSNIRAVPRVAPRVSVTTSPTYKSSSLYMKNVSLAPEHASTFSKRKFAKTVSGCRLILLHQQTSSELTSFLYTTKIFIRSIVAFCTLAWMHSAPAVAAASTTETLHVGQKIANYFRGFGIPDVAILAIISALPVVELRGAVPVGIWMGLPIATVLPACVLGNMAPIIPLLFLLRSEKIK